MSDLLNCPVIDCHVHIHQAAGAPAMRELLRQCGLRQVAIQSIPAYENEGPGQNIGGLLAKVANPGRVFLFGGMQYDHPHLPVEAMDLLGQVKRLIAAGADGIKMIEGKPGTRLDIGDIPLDSPVYDDVYGYLEAKQIPLLSHVADPATFWDPARCPEWAVSAGWAWFRPDFPTLKRLHTEVAHLLTKFPRLRVIFAHFYFLSEDVTVAARFMDDFPNANLDITPGIEMFEDFSKQPAVWRDFFTTYQDRLFFGTDNICYRKTQTVEDAAEKVQQMRRFLETDGKVKFWDLTLNGMALPSPVLEKLYYRNFQRLVGVTPKAVDRALAVAECARVIAFAESRPELHAQIPAYRRILKRLEM